MSEIRVKDNESLESALRRFKRSCAKSGVLAEVRKREHYEKPSVKRKKKAEAALTEAKKKKEAADAQVVQGHKRVKSLEDSVKAQQEQLGKLNVTVDKDGKTSASQGKVDQKVVQQVLQEHSEEASSQSKKLQINPLNSVPGLLEQILEELKKKWF